MNKTEKSNTGRGNCLCKVVVVVVVVVRWVQGEERNVGQREYRPDMADKVVARLY